MKRCAEEPLSDENMEADELFGEPDELLDFLADLAEDVKALSRKIATVEASFLQFLDMRSTSPNLDQ